MQDNELSKAIQKMHVKMLDNKRAMRSNRIKNGHYELMRDLAKMNNCSIQSIMDQAYRDFINYHYIEHLKQKYSKDN